MSEENVEIVRRVYEAVSRRPKPDFDTVNALFDPEHELVSLTGQLDGRSLKGVRGFGHWLAEAGETWQSWEAEVGEVRDIGANRVLAHMTWTAVSMRGGVPVEQPLIALMTLREGRIARTEVYDSREQALEAAGLSE